MNKWTTFLKARMVCSVLEEDGTETHFDELGESRMTFPVFGKPVFRTRGVAPEFPVIHPSVNIPVARSGLKLFEEQLLSRFWLP